MAPAASCSNLICYNLCPLLSSPLKFRNPRPTPPSLSLLNNPKLRKSSISSNFIKNGTHSNLSPFDKKRNVLQIGSASNSLQNLVEPIVGKGGGSDRNEIGNGGDGNGGGGRDWTTSILLFLFYAGVMYYVFNLTPNQTPSRDMYFLEKLLNLKGNDGFRMNQVLVSLWYIMGLWPIVYSMLLLPTGRSSKGSIPVWPFLVLSFFLGAYALIPYFILWKPPASPVKEDELRRWPLNFLESKITAGVIIAAGLGLIAYAGLATTGDWMEFYQYFRESKLVHLTSVDFTLLSAFAPFWVYNDMTSRKCERLFWLLPFSAIPLLGPSLYLLLRPTMSAEPLPLKTSTEADSTP